MDFSQDLYDSNDAPTIFTQLCDVGTGKYEPHIHRDQASQVTDTCENPQRENIITCKDHQLQEFIDDGGGLALDLSLAPVNTDLPSYIAVLDKRTAFMSRFVLPSDVDTVGMTLVDIVRTGVVLRAGTYQEVGEVTFNRTVTLGDAMLGKRTILFSSGSDTLIERLWREYEECQLFPSIRAMGFSMVTGINFSVIRGECAMGQHLNQKKSLMSAYLASQAGSPAIPHVYFADGYHVELWSDYLKRNPQVNLVSMNCQLQKKRTDIDAVIKGISTLMERFPYLHFVLTGFHLDQMHRFGPLLPRIHFAEKKAVKYAHSRKKIFLDIGTMKFKASRVHEAVEDVMRHNINQRRMYVELVKQKMLAQYTIPADIQELIYSTFYTDTTCAMS